MKAFIVVDMQNDFITGALKNEHAESIVPKIIERIAANASKDCYLVATRDTHYDDYMKTAEAKKLPIPHCIEGTEGWKYNKEIHATLLTYLPAYANGDKADEFFMIDVPYIDKPTFGSLDLVNYFYNIPEKITEFTLCGTCTDICVVSNALLLRAAFPDATIKVIKECCAGTNKSSHEAAILTMKNCQIDII